MITLKQLRYALAAEKTLHFRKAASLCNVSQSAFSIGLSELEKHLGIQIFERDTKKVLITPSGQEVLEIARTILLQVEDLNQMKDREKGPFTYPITVGVIPTIAPFLLPKLFPLLEKAYPNAELNIVEEQSEELVDLVRKGEVDTAILALPFPLDGLMSFEFWEEDFYWVALKGEPYTDLNEISRDEVSDSNLMLLKNGHCLKEHILDACKLTETTANHGFGAASLNTLVQMVLGKLGTTLIPEMAKDQLTSQNKDLSAIHLNEPGPHRRIAFIIRPNYTRLSIIEALKEICKKALGSKK
ncbi:MAG: hydrogen peroxide-inducible genes activator [Sneathiellales bacterium]|nr:hydrogen peroxide-inducible genes activator [Sneathiellales bacterium]